MNEKNKWKQTFLIMLFYWMMEEGGMKYWQIYETLTKSWNVNDWLIKYVGRIFQNVLFVLIACLKINFGICYKFKIFVFKIFRKFVEICCWWENLK